MKKYLIFLGCRYVPHVEWRALWDIDHTHGAEVLTSRSYFRKITTSFIQKKKSKSNHILDPNLIAS